MELPIYYDEAEEWKNTLFLYNSALREINTKLEILNDEFKLAHSYNPIEHITSRIKSPESIAKKIRHKNKELTVENIVKYVNDVAGIRVICSFTSDIYRLADAITNQNDVKVLKVKDYIMNPKENGYKSYHMIVSVPIFLTDNVINTKVEIQIRTIAMDFWASLEHKIYYKFEGNAPERIRKDLRECADIIQYLDHKMMSLNSEIQSYNKNSLSDYKEIMAQNYMNCMKESYGSVIDEDEEDEQKMKEADSNAKKANNDNAPTKEASSSASDLAESVKKILFRKKQA
ncbi:MAG: GTP pyrophosphokinase family protein [Clostridium sp.]|nr:GTP pyrophosphokinase family protein [Clostridium sp.]